MEDVLCVRAVCMWEEVGGGGKTQNYLTSKSKSERGGEISRISGGGLERGL